MRSKLHVSMHTKSNNAVGKYLKTYIYFTVLCGFCIVYEFEINTFSKPIDLLLESGGTFKYDLCSSCDINVDLSVSRSYRKQIGASSLNLVSISYRKSGFSVTPKI